MVPPEHPEAADPQEPKPEEPTPGGPEQAADSPPEKPEKSDSADSAEDSSDDTGSDSDSSAEDKPEPAEDKNPEPADGKPADAEATETLTAVGPPTRRSNIRLSIAIGLAMLVLIGGGVTIIALASQDRPEDIELQKNIAEARGVVERFAVLFGQARNDGAFSLSKSDVKALLCSREQDALEQEWQERETKEINRSSSPETPPARLALTVKDIKIEGEIGVATLTGSLADRKTDQDFGLVKEQGQWKVCDVVFRIPKASSSASSNPGTPSSVETTGTTTDTTEPTGTGTGSGTTTTTTTTTETQ
jgi:hypothetical protein